MTKIIILPNEDLDRFYERTLNYLDAKNVKPTNLRSGKGDPNQSILDAQGRHLANQSVQKNIPNGKAVY